MAEVLETAPLLLQSSECDGAVNGAARSREFTKLEWNFTKSKWRGDSSSHEFKCASAAHHM